MRDFLVFIFNKNAILFYHFFYLRSMKLRNVNHKKSSSKYALRDDRKVSLVYRAARFSVYKENR